MDIRATQKNQRLILRKNCAFSLIPKPMSLQNLNFSPAFPDGHFYSPVVNIQDVKERSGQIWPEDPRIEGIDFNKQEQARIIREEFRKYLTLYDYPDNPPPNYPEDQFFTGNSQFGWLDSRALFVMLHAIKPRKMIEIGSGYSSLLTADVNHRFLNNSIEFTCIEPYPRQFLLKGIKGISQVITKRVEDIPLDIFNTLDKGDILFVDSSHVSKTGSDVNHIIFNILPRLKTGVYIHFHDIFLPNDYPQEWVINQGRSWNEQYILRALLMYTTAFKIVFNGIFAYINFREELTSLLGTEAFGGGSMWLVRV